MDSLRRNIPFLHINLCKFSNEIVNFHAILISIYRVSNAIHSLPRDKSTLFGYSMHVFFSVVCCEAYFIANGSLLVLFISICLYHQTFYKKFRNKYIVSLKERQKKINSDCSSWISVNHLLVIKS